MAFPTVATINGGTTSGTSHVINLPSGIQSGDLLLAAVAFDGGPTISGWPAGWTQLFALNPGGTSGVKVECRFRRADGGEGASFTLTTSVSEIGAHTTFRVAGHHTTSDPEQASTSGTTGTSADPPLLNPVGWDAEDTLWIAVCGHDDGTISITVFPTSYTNTREDRDNTVSGVGVGTCRRELNAASEDPAAFTLSATNDWVAGVVAIRPAVAASPDPFRRFRRVPAQQAARALMPQGWEI